jgi:predicted acylesterase/phospholipase RssA
MRLGLALSGGGLRATLFHLGVAKALQTHNVLKDVKHITSVSGGSIFAAHLVKNWTSYLDEETFDQAAQEIIDFARMDVRGRIFRRLTLPPYYLLPYIDNLRQRPRRFRRDGTVRNLLFERYLKTLFGDATLGELAAANDDAPALDILATNLTRGSLAYFNGGAFVPSDDETSGVIPARTTVARAVMTSALFPAVFPTVELNADNLLADPNLFSQAEYFTDGGVYDNLGIRRFETVLKSATCPVDKVLVCDASGTFERLVGPETLGYWKTALRSTDILMKRLAELEYEIASTAPNSFAFVRISDVINPAEDSGLAVDIQRQVKNIRTDLDRFSTTEIDTIAEHGYSVAARKLDELYPIPTANARDVWRPFANRKRRTESETVRLIKRARFHSKNLVRWNDWASYVHPVLFVILLVLAWRWYDSGRFDRYYNTLPATERELAEPIHEPVTAAREVNTALVRESAKAETRLHVAFIAYNLWTNGQTPRAVFADALQQLGNHNLERSRFEEARWRHYFAALPKKSTFGVPRIEDAAVATTALAFVNDAIPYVSPDSLVETARTSYGVFIATNDVKSTRPLAFHALELLKNALDDLDKPGAENRLNEQNGFRAKLLEGHYYLESGRLQSDPKVAEDLLRKAEQTYAEAGTVSVLGEYWKVEYNRCNALDEAANAVRKYRDSRTFAVEAERQALDSVIATTVNQALERCSKAQELPGATWQPSYKIGWFFLEKDDLKSARDSFLRGYEVAKGTGRKEAESYVGYLNEKKESIAPLCRDSEFSRTFFKVCW